MSHDIIIDLTSERVQRNSYEYYTQPRATWRDNPDIYVQSWGLVVKNLCQRIHDEGEVDPEALVHVLRGNKPVFRPMSLTLWVNPPDRRPDNLKRPNRPKEAS